MHELSLVQSMMTIILEERDRHGLGKVSRVRLRNGALAGAVTEALTFAWEALTPGSELEGAELLVEEVPLRVRCGSCKAEFEPEDRHYMPCPQCGEFLGHEVLAGKELLIESIEAD
ncbi:hydrogenase maturation nickel metallochaperone HypA [Desulfovibrio aminophilus]|nr:hydrogenase maturation nickel metallochaperone HypA [Desulfovibrio aminophilus]MCM0756588.1 hydrogenase maturation nickel metallochaperone HypA [Desulfovibrio aminophilus]